MPGMDGVGKFSKTLVCLGTLAGADLVNNARFLYQPDSGNFHYEAMVYTGNRVNLYINNNIRSTEQVSPNSFGIQVAWTFTSYSYEDRNNPSLSPWTIRDLDLGSLAAVPGTGSDPLTNFMEDSKIEYAVDGSANMTRQFGELGHNIYMFPPFVSTMPGSLERWHIIPLTARADFIRIYFWCDPADWVGGGAGFLTDRVTIYALSGSDVAGSQRIGGGQG